MAEVAQPLLSHQVMMISIKLGGFGAVLLLATGISRLSFGYEEIVVKNGGTLNGAVKLAGAIPKLPHLQVTKYKEVCKDVPNESLIVGHAQGLRYAVVTLEGIAKGKAVEKESVHELDNVKCRFLPHVQAASVGQFILFKNSDPILHTDHKKRQRLLGGIAEFGNFFRGKYFS